MPRLPFVTALPLFYLLSLGRICSSQGPNEDGSGSEPIAQYPITCAGSRPLQQQFPFLLAGQNEPEGPHMTLADFCSIPLNIKCIHADYNHRGTHIGALELHFGTLTNYYLATNAGAHPPLELQARYHEIERASDFCSLKCTCGGNEFAAAILPTPLTVPDDGYGNVWNFDALASQPTYNVVPFSWSIKRGIFWSVPRVTRRRMYTGDIVNRPNCVTSPIEPWFDHAINRINMNLGPYRDAARLCLHPYFLTAKTPSLGGICVNRPGMQSQLSFPPELRSYHFEPPLVMATPSRLVLQFANIVEMYCRLKCTCNGKPGVPGNSYQDILRTDAITDWAIDVLHPLDGPSYPIYPRLPLGRGPGGFRLSSAGYMGNPLPTCYEVEKCTKNADCGEGCTCRAVEVLTPYADKALSFIGKCGVALALTGRARLVGSRLNPRDMDDRRTEEEGTDEQHVSPFPCACNGTYVSNSCCLSTDGFVQEHSDLKIGELLSDL